MAAGYTLQKPSRVIPILAALVGAIGVIIAALISSGVLETEEAAPNGDGMVTTPSPSPSPEPEPEPEPQPPPPQIDGRYHLDATNARIILVRQGEGDTYLISEELPADWPFDGVVAYTGQDSFEGDATFASGQTMDVTMRLMPNGHLDTDFVFTDADGVPTGRVDHHEFVPAA